MTTFTVISHCLITFVDKDLESKIQDDLRLDQERYPETEEESFMLKALVRYQPLLFQLLVAYEIATTFSNSRGGRLRELRLYLYVVDCS